MSSLGKALLRRRQWSARAGATSMSAMSPTPSNENARIVVVRDTQVLVVDADTAPYVPTLAELSAWLEPSRPRHLVGRFETQEVYAIASEDAGRRYGLAVLRRGIANQPTNLTRFVIVASTPGECDPLVDAKVSLVFATRHELGALVRCLNVLADEGVSLTKLESRPRPGTAWEYVFYVDFEGHLSEPRVQSALAGLAVTTQFVRVLGCYPRLRAAGT